MWLYSSNRYNFFFYKHILHESSPIQLSFIHKNLIEVGPHDGMDQIV